MVERMTKNEELFQMINDCKQRESKLSDWERGYISSISDQLGHCMKGEETTLSDDQFGNLELI